MMSVSCNASNLRISWNVGDLPDVQDLDYLSAKIVKFTRTELDIVLYKCSDQGLRPDYTAIVKLNDSDRLAVNVTNKAVRKQIGSKEDLLFLPTPPTLIREYSKLEEEGILVVAAAIGANLIENAWLLRCRNMPMRNFELEALRAPPSSSNQVVFAKPEPRRVVVEQKKDVKRAIGQSLAADTTPNRTEIKAAIDLLNRAGRELDSFEMSVDELGVLKARILIEL